MRILPALGLTLLALAGCKDETISGYAPAGTLWRLSDLDGAPFPARATLGFPEEGKIAGQGPCNRYSASQSAPYPWFEAGPVLTTKRACPELAAEQAFLAGLARATLVEVADDILILSTEDGFQMVFSAEP